MINCIIVDDEPIARDILTSYIRQIPYLQLVGSCTDAFEAMEALHKNTVDLIILDIHMPRLSGFEMLRSLKKYPAVIITSAHSEYALEGFELSVTDYLLKPFSFQRFVQATEKVNKANQASLSAGPTEEVEDYVMVKSDKKLIRIYYNDILFVEAYGNYIFINRNGDKVMSKQTLTQFEQQLPANRFIRVHKSYIVSLKAISCLEGNEVTIGNRKIPVGKVYRENLLKIFPR